MKKFISSLVLMMFIILITGCFEEKKADIKIGVLLGISGKYSNLGSQIKDGVVLAFEEINYKIKEKNVKLILKDDMQNEKENAIRIQELINDDIKIIIGNATSSMTQISLSYVNKKKDVLLFSPTSSSNVFSNLDDNLIRLQSSISGNTFRNFEKMLEKEMFKKIFFIGDRKNKSYVNNYENILQEYLIKKGYPAFVKSIDSSLSYKKILKEVQSVESDLILIIANAIDTSNIIQYLRLNNVNKVVVSSGWARTHDFISNIGKNQKNIYVSASYETDKTLASYKEFNAKFQKLYNRKPTSFDIQGYESAKIIIDALNNVQTDIEVKDYILKTKDFKSISGTTQINKFGDKIEDYYILKVQNNEFIKIKFE